MTQSTGKTGRGVSFEVSDGQSPPVFSAIANVSGITPSGRNAEEIDFTHLLSDGGFREFRQGFKDAGTIGINMHLDPTNETHQRILALFTSGDLFEWRINFGAAWPGYYLIGIGFIQNPGDIDINVDGPISSSATVRVSGNTAFAYNP